MKASSGRPVGEVQRHVTSLRARLGAEVRLARLAAGLTQAQLGARAGVSQGVVSRIERGAGPLSLELVARLCAASGHELSVRVFPVAGVRLRDSGQLEVAEALRRSAPPRWAVRLEVPVAAAPDQSSAEAGQAGASGNHRMTNSVARRTPQPRGD